jgi:hypothetical protein
MRSLIAASSSFTIPNGFTGAWSPRGEVAETCPGAIAAEGAANERAPRGAEASRGGEADPRRAIDDVASSRERPGGGASAAIGRVHEKCDRAGARREVSARADDARRGSPAARAAHRAAERRHAPRSPIASAANVRLRDISTNLGETTRGAARRTRRRGGASARGREARDAAPTAENDVDGERVRVWRRRSDETSDETFDRQRGGVPEVRAAAPSGRARRASKRAEERQFFG